MASNTPTGSTRPNVALVVLDTVRKDVFDEYFDWLPGRRFENAWAPSHWTVPVHAALFGGKYASELGVHAKNTVLDCPEPVLAERLSDRGYRTRAFCSNPNVSPAFGFDRGFDEFDGGWRLKAFDPEIFDWQGYVSESGATGVRKYLGALYECARSDCRTIDSLKFGVNMKMRFDKRGSSPDDGAGAALKKLRKTRFDSTGEFFFLNLMEAHAPYDPPEEYKTVDAAYPGDLRAVLDEPLSDPDDLRQAYRDSVRYLSDMYREMFTELQSSFDYVVTCADHGELLGERGGWEHLSGVDPELTHVPLVVSGPNLEDTSNEVVSLLDAHTTVTELAGCESVDGQRGRSLLAASSGQDDRDAVDASVLTEYHGLTDGHRKGLLEDGFDPAPFLAERFGVAVPDDYYGYQDGETWREQGTVTTDPQPRDLLDTLRATRDVREVTSEDLELSDAAMDQLKDLGYV
jgi:arylsulfatase A-like enzyme